MQRRLRKSELAVRRFFALFRLGIFICLLAFTYELAKLPQWYVHKDAFKSTHNEYLSIYGNEITPDYKILNALKNVDIPNHPIYLIDTKPMVNEIMKIEPIKRVYIRRFWWPARFDIMVEERRPILEISPSEKVAPIAFFTEGGKLISREYLPLKNKDKYNTTLILTYGTKGDDYQHWSEAKIKQLDKLSKYLSSYSGEHVKYIDLRNPHDVYVQLTTVKLRLGELDDTVFKRIQSVSSILPQIKNFKKKIKYVDLRWEETNYLKLEYDKTSSKD